jgi:hypothetical protein
MLSKAAIFLRRFRALQAMATPPSAVSKKP